MIAALGTTTSFVKDGEWLFAERKLYVDWIGERAVTKRLVIGRREWSVVWPRRPRDSDVEAVTAIAREGSASRTRLKEVLHPDFADAPPAGRSQARMRPSSHGHVCGVVRTRSCARSPWTTTSSRAPAEEQPEAAFSPEREWRDPTGRSRLPYARYKGSRASLPASPRVHIPPAYIYPWATEGPT